VEQDDRDHVARKTAGARAQEDVGRRARREPYLARAALGDVVGDLHARAAGPHDQDALARERLGVAIFARVEEPAAEQLASRPVRNDRLLLVARGHDHLRSAELALRRLECPSSVRAIDPLDPRGEPQVDPVLARVPLDMLNELVARGEHRRALLEAPLRKVR
jgi:hypothetical protein